MPGGAAVVRVSWVAVRAEPSHRSEMVSQWVLGEPLEVLAAKQEWVRAAGPDGYEAWCSRGAVAGLPDLAAWEARAGARSLGTFIRISGKGGHALRLPWGARVGTAGDGIVELPDGITGRPDDPDAVVGPEDRPGRLPRRPEAVVASARRWLGAPYLWGGRTELGADCSGLVQAVYALHGIALPRDSDPQSRVGPEVARERVDDPSSLDLLPADLLFFGTGAKVTHVAVATGGTGLLHAADSRGGVTEDDLAGATDFHRRLRETLRVARRPIAT